MPKTAKINTTRCLISAPASSVFDTFVC
jgi:hypothetical protein